MSKYNGLGKLITRIGLSIFIAVAGGYLVAQSINNANAADARTAERLPANQELLVQFLVYKDVPFMAMNNKLTIYADQDGKFPEWLTCNYIHANVSDVPLESITMKDYTANQILRTEICLVTRFKK